MTGQREYRISDNGIAIILRVARTLQEGSVEERDLHELIDSCYTHPIPASDADIAAAAVAEERRKRFKIIESIPDKNGIIIIGVKESPDGDFVSRESALKYVQHDARVKADLLDELSQWANKNNENHIDEDGDHLPCVVTGRLINKINSLRGERK